LHVEDFEAQINTKKPRKIPASYYSFRNATSFLGDIAENGLNNKRQTPNNLKACSFIGVGFFFVHR
jgi:hypothetical protein